MRWVALIVLMSVGTAFADPPDIQYLTYPRWQPKPRDQGILLAPNGNDLTIAIDPKVCQRLVKAVQDRDGEVLADLAAKREVISAKHLDPVVLIEPHEAEGKDTISWTVRLIAGERKGSLAYVPTMWLGRVRTQREIAKEKASLSAPNPNPMRPGGAVARPRKAPAKAKESPKSAPPAPRALIAGNLLHSAAQLEKRGATEVAGKIYAQIVKEYPDLPQAELAKKRLEALKQAPSR